MLSEEVEANRRSIRSDGYAMSIGEVVNLYRDKDIQIRPEFQRLFRWSLEKQSRLIESILLDIPLPPIFVAQREDGVWEVVDGLQRLSTILQFMGELRDETTGELMSPSQLYRTKYLPSLEGATYTGDGSGSFPPALRIHFKRARLDFRIILRESDDAVKYEVFDRLNSGGAPTSPQEVRTAQLLMISPDFYTWLDTMRSESPFIDCAPLTDRALSEQYDLELVTRFFVLNMTPNNDLRRFSEMDTFLTDRILEISRDPDFDRSLWKQLFEDVFGILSRMGLDVFRKYDGSKGRSVGAFSVSAYEAVILGMSENIESWKNLNPSEVEALLRERVAELWKDSEFRRYSGAGIRATQRAPMMRPTGARIFALD
ncbi:DUF262 domain-containing protein [Streptomyces sp. NPDC057460]|uniref:DUF262 domain-containing protein n=1 Tax=Streptomyces sp. NPDC057460 TaxID=3346141 RepID=UPI0036C15838